MNFFVYVIENKNGRWYIGQTNNLEARIERHNSQKVKSTKNRGVWRIIYQENAESRQKALKREGYLKSGAGRNFLKTLLNK